MRGRFLQPSAGPPAGAKGAIGDGHRPRSNRRSSNAVRHRVPQCRTTDRDFARLIGDSQFRRFGLRRSCSATRSGKSLRRSHIVSEIKSLRKHAPQLIPAARTLDSSVDCRAAGISLISRAAATPTLRAYQSALRAAGITSSCFAISCRMPLPSSPKATANRHKGRERCRDVSPIHAAPAGLTGRSACQCASSFRPCCAWRK